MLLERIDHRAKTMDLVRAMQALSIIQERANAELLKKIRHEINQRLKSSKFKVIDIMTLMQAEARFGRFDDVKTCQKLITMQPEEVNSKIIVNLVETYCQIKSDHLLPEFKELILNYVFANYMSLSFD